jgi:DME family drug/metabolite transporter
LSGEAYAIACAFLWALSSTLVKSQTHKMSIVLLGALRTIPALIMYWCVLLFSGRAGEPFRLPLRIWALFTGSTVVGLVVGDLLYFQSMKTIGLSRAMPISTTYPFFTLAFSVLFLDEQFDWIVVLGAVLIAVGAYLLAVPQDVQKDEGDDRSRQRIDLVGVGLAFVAAVCWAASTVMVRAGLSEVDVAVANSVRLSILLVSLLVLLPRQGNHVAQVKSYGLSTLAVVFLAGILGMGLGTFTFLAAVKHAGAARTSILTASTPLFGLPFSLLLKEKLSARTFVGTVMTVLGVGLALYY